MKKQIIKIISVALLISVLSLVLSSCGGINVGKGYTAGFIDGNIQNEYWWVETYSELVNSISSFESYRSTFLPNIPVSYDGDLFDMKYCFKMNSANTDRHTGIFVDFDERCVQKIDIMCFAFTEDVKMNDLLHSDVSRYNAYQIIPSMEYVGKYGPNYNELSIDMLNCIEYYNVDRQIVYEYRYKNDNTLVLSIVSTKFLNNERLTNDAVNAILGSIDFELYQSMKDYIVNS